MTKKINVFISYSPYDEDFKKAVEKHLALLKRSNKIATWDSSNVLVGNDLNTAIRLLDNAHIIIILTSANYIADDDLWKQHLQRAMERHNRGEAKVIPIKLSDFANDNLPFANIQGLPRDGNPIRVPSNDTVLAAIADELTRLVNDLLAGGVGIDATTVSTTQQPNKDISNQASIKGNNNIVIQGLNNGNISISTDKENTPLPPKQKILFLAANPNNAAALATDQEYRLITAELERGRHRDRYEFLQPRISLTVHELIRAVKVKPDIIHFAGHGVAGDKDDAHSPAGIVIVDDNNKSQVIPAAALSLLFKGLQGSTQLVILNACYSAQQAQIISTYDMYVIGHNLPIGDAAAISFARGLYIGLSEGMDIENAYNDACIALMTTNPTYSEVVEIWKNGSRL